MKVVFAHTDFRIYWPDRLAALDHFLKKQSIDLEIIEIAGAGSPYGFAGKNDCHSASWHCLFPGKKMEELSMRDANRALRKKLDEIKPDIVFAGAIAFPSGAAAVRWSSENDKKVIIFDNARLNDVPRPWRIDFIKKKIYSCADAVFCPSPAWDDTFNYFGFKNDQIFYGLNVVNNSFWQKDVTGAITNIPKDYILTVGRQIPKKNFLFLLKAYLSYTKKQTNPRDLVIVGNGPKRPVLEEFARNNKLRTVHFLSFQSQEQLNGLYKNASMFVLPSKYGETWGLVVNEAMASSLPVLVSNQVGCASTLVKEGINGYTFSPSDENELSELLLKMHNLPDEDRKALGQRSLEIIDEWGLERFCKGAYEALLWTAAQKKHRPGLLNRIILKLWKGRYRPV